MAAARASSHAKFRAQIELIKSGDQGAYEWLMAKGPVYWSRSHFRTTPQCDVLVNNLCKSFNGIATILTARERPILSLLERVRMYIMKRFSKQRLAVAKWHGNLGPKVAKILEKNKVESATFFSTWCGLTNYQVHNAHGSIFSVDLGRKTCSCRKWDLTGIPCAHAISCIWLKREQPESYVSKWYSKEVYLPTYNNLIYSIRDKEDWP